VPGEADFIGPLLAPDSIEKMQKEIDASNLNEYGDYHLTKYYHFNDNLSLWYD
jgi:hypothetical protein